MFLGKWLENSTSEAALAFTFTISLSQRCKIQGWSGRRQWNFCLDSFVSPIDLPMTIHSDKDSRCQLSGPRVHSMAYQGPKIKLFSTSPASSLTHTISFGDPRRFSIPQCASLCRSSVLLLLLLNLPSVHAIPNIPETPCKRQEMNHFLTNLHTLPKITLPKKNSPNF